MVTIQISVSSSHGKRMARLRQAEQLQHKGYKLAQIVQLISTPEFSKYYATQFQSYLAGRRDILTTGDQNHSDNAYLDVITFLNSVLDSLGAKQVVKLDKDDEPDINTRMGDQKHITYSDNAKNSRIGITIKTVKKD